MITLSNLLYMPQHSWAVNYIEFNYGYLRRKLIVIFSAILHQWNWYYFSTLAFIKATRIFYIFDYKLHFCLDFWFIYSKGILPNLPKTSTVRTPLRGDPQRELLCPLSGGGVSASLRGRLLSCVCRSVGVKRRHTGKSGPFSENVPIDYLTYSRYAQVYLS